MDELAELTEDENEDGAEDEAEDEAEVGAEGVERYWKDSMDRAVSLVFGLRSVCSESSSLARLMSDVRDAPKSRILICRNDGF